LGSFALLYPLDEPNLPLIAYFFFQSSWSNGIILKGRSTLLSSRRSAATEIHNSRLETRIYL